VKDDYTTKAMSNYFEFLMSRASLDEHQGPQVMIEKSSKE
jgi:hypothetical protein